MQDITVDPKTLSEPKLDAAIEWCTTRPPHFGTLVGLRREKLRRQFEHALNKRIEEDPHLASTTTVTLS